MFLPLDRFFAILMVIEGSVYFFKRTERMMWGEGSEVKPKRDEEGSGMFVGFCGDGWAIDECSCETGENMGESNTGLKSL